MGIERKLQISSFMVGGPHNNFQHFYISLIFRGKTVVGPTVTAAKVLPSWSRVIKHLPNSHTGPRNALAYSICVKYNKIRKVLPGPGTHWSRDENENI